MGQKGSICDYVIMRNAQLLEEYKKAVKEATSPINANHIFRSIVNKPCPQFWISPEHAMKLISAIRRNKVNIKALSPTRQEMITEIMERVNKLIAVNRGLLITHAVEIVVYSPAPKFYLTPESAKTILCKYRKCKKSKSYQY